MRKTLRSSVFKGAEAEKLAKENEKELPDGWEKYRGSLTLQKSRWKNFKEIVVDKCVKYCRKEKCKCGEEKQHWVYLQNEHFQ